MLRFIPERVRTSDVSSSARFEDMLLRPEIQQAIADIGFINPSPVQLKSLPPALAGNDLIVQSKSGTGKTLVFGITALQRLSPGNGVSVLILAPTREIAVQIGSVISDLARYMTPAVRIHVFIGGVAGKQDRRRARECDIAVGTPGRVAQMIRDGELEVDRVRLLVLDEFDSESFMEHCKPIIHSHSLNRNRQNIACSATITSERIDLLNTFMNLPVHVFVSVDAPSLEGVKQYYWKIIADHDPQAYIEKVKALIQILDSVPFHQCVVFSNYKSRAEDIVESLNKFGWPCVYIAGGMDQSSRNEAVSKLKSFSIRVLVSTDVAARGIDVDKVTLVINLDLPKDKSTYLHRVGRTGRFGTLGTAISIVNADEFQVLRGFIRETNSAIEEIDLNLVRNQAKKSLTNDHFDEAQKKALDDMESHGKLSPELFEEQVKAISLKEDIRKAEKEKKKNMNESKEKLKNSKSKSTKRLPSPSRFFESFRPFPFDQYENVPLRDLIFPR